METRKLHPAASVQRIAIDNSSLRFGLDSRKTEWRVPAAIPTDNGWLHSENQHHAVRCVPGGAASSQDARDDVRLPPTMRSSSVMRGLSEVTNYLEYENGSGRWRHARNSTAYIPKQLPASAYTEHFRSLSNVSGYEPRYCSATIDLRGSSHWRDRDEFVQLQDSTMQITIRKSQETPSKPSNHSYNRSAMFQSLGSPPGITSYNSSRPSASYAHAQRSELSILHGRPSASLSGNPRSSNVLEGQHRIVAVPSMRKRAFITEQADSKGRSEDPDDKRVKLGMLDILCSATLELGPIQANPVTGCSCPRSNCIKLYCDCFKAGRPCSGVCSCLNCKNTEEETKIDGERIRAIKNTLARNPRAFTGGKKEAVPQNPGDTVCNCLKSRCLKLYCHCFHKGRTCNEACLCISCLNTPLENVVGGRRNLAIQNCLEKRPDAFTKKPKAVGAGCACKNNKCLKKYW